MSEIIYRSRIDGVRKVHLPLNGAQVSFNSDAHLVVRFADGPDDVLVVFDADNSQRIVRFCQEHLRARENGVPF